MPARNELGGIFECLIFEDAEDFGDRRADHFSGGLRGLAGRAEGDRTCKGDEK
jgi:hypothetical protein